MNFKTIGLVTLMGCVSACSNVVVKQPAPATTLAAHNRAISNSDYRIKSGDDLDIRFFYIPDLNTSVTVRPDGKVNLSLVGDVQAAGMSVTQLAESLKKAYAADIKRPDATVNVRNFANQRIFVGGEVVHSGMQPLVGNISVLQALMVAEGLKDSANPNEVVIIRRTEENERLVFSVDLESIISGTDTTQDVLLQPFDVVVVPRSDISNVNSWVDRYIRRNLPINTGFSYTINKNRSVSQQ